MFGLSTNRKGFDMSNATKLIEDFLTAPDEKQYAVECVRAMVDRKDAEMGSEGGLVVAKSETLEKLILASRSDVLYTGDVFRAINAFCKPASPELGKKTARELIDGLINAGCALRSEQYPSRVTVDIETIEQALSGIAIPTAPTTPGGVHCPHGTEMGKNAGWYKLSGSLTVYADMLRDLETDYMDFEGFALEGGEIANWRMYLSIAHAGVSTLELIKRRLQLSLGSLSGHGGFTHSELTNYVEFIRLYSESARGLVKFVQRHMNGDGESYETLGCVQGRLAYLSGCFDWVVNGFQDCARRIMDAKAFITPEQDD